MTGSYMESHRGIRNFAISDVHIMNAELEVEPDVSAKQGNRRSVLRSLLWQVFARSTDVISTVSVVYVFVTMAWIAGRPGENVLPGGEFRGIPIATWNLPLAFFGIFWILIRGSLRCGATYLAWEAKRPYRQKLVFFGGQVVFLVIFTVVATYLSVARR